MSFELKPLQYPRGGQSAKHLSWSLPRNSVPPLLADRISLPQWQSTFDALFNHYRVGLDKANNTGFLGKMFNAGSIEREWQNGWQYLLQSEQRKYQKLNVQVTLCREVITVASYTGHARDAFNRIVGLAFAVGPAPGGGRSGGGSSGDVVEQLEKLNRLYKSGAITEKEFNKAKKKLLG